MGLAGKQNPPEARNYAYGVLQHLARRRWEACSPVQRAQLAQLALRLLKEVAEEGEPFPVKSKAAVFMAEVVRSNGGDLLMSLIPELFALAHAGPAQAEVAVQVLRWLPEEIGVSGDELSAEHKRRLLSVLLEVLPQVLPFLYQLIGTHYGAAVASAQQGNAGLAAAHGAVVSAVLSATLALADWAPVVLLASTGLVTACGHLLGAEDFALGACEILKQVCSRRRGNEEAGAYREAMRLVLEVLLGPAANILKGQYEGLQDSDLGLRVCETLSHWGQEHVGCVRDAERLSLYLQQMLSIASHPSFVVSNLTHGFWPMALKVLGDSGRKDAPGLPDGFLEALLEMIADRVKRDPSWGLASWPGEFDTYQEFREFHSVYRHKFIEVVKQISRMSPAVAVVASGRHVEAALASMQTAEANSVECAQVDAAASLFQAVMIVLKPYQLGNPALVPPLNNLLERILAVEYRGPRTLVHYLRFIEAYGKFFAAVQSPGLVPAVLRLVDTFAVATVGPNPNAPLTGEALAVSKEIFGARQQAASTVLIISREARSGLAQHLQSLAQKVQGMWQQGVLRHGERNALYESLVVIATAGGEGEVQNVVSWLVAPLQQEWTSPAWQQGLLSVAQFIPTFTGQQLPLPALGPAKDPIGGNDARLALFHEVQLIERILRRLAYVKKRDRPDDQGPAVSHAFAPHVEWALPGVIAIIKCIHLCWTPEVRSQLGFLNPALEMGSFEKAFNLGQGLPGHLLVTRGEDEDPVGVGGSSLAAFRSWIKGTRDSSYQFLGLATTTLPEQLYSYTAIASQLCPAILAGLEYAETRHLRMIVRTSLTGIVRLCPEAYWSHWLLPWVPAFCSHLHRKLNRDWAAELADPGAKGEKAKDTLSDEMISERHLRELTRDHLGMLLLLASDYVDPTRRRAKTSTTFLLWLLQYDPNSAASLMATAVAAVTWPDSDAAAKGTKICRVILNASRKDGRLVNLVCRDVLAAALSGLTLVSHADFQSELLMIIRDILVWFGDSNHVPQQLLLSLPNVTPEVFAQFQQAMKANPSEKDQRGLVRKLLLKSGASLKALAQSHSPGAKLPQFSMPKVRATARNGDFDEDPPVRLFD